MMPAGGCILARNATGESFAGLGTDCTVRSARRSSVKNRRPVPPSGGPASLLKIETGMSTLVPVLGTTYCRHSVSPAKASAGVKATTARAADRRYARMERSPVRFETIESNGVRSSSRYFLGRCLARDMLPRDIPERQRGSERDAGAGIVAAHDARHVVAGGIEARDRLTVLVQRTGVFVGPDAGIGAEIADHQLDRVEWPVLDRRDAGVRAVQRIALVAVIGARALAEGGIAAFRGWGVELGDRGLEPLPVDAGAVGQFGKRGAAFEIAGRQMMAQRHRKRWHASEAIFSQGAVIAHEVR